MPAFGKTQPFAVDVKAGESAWICTCGQSKNAPYCDGSHSNVAGSAGPQEYKASEDTTIYVCGCGKSGNGIFCDGSHNA